MNQELPKLPLSKDEKNILNSLIEKMASDNYSYKKSYTEFHRLLAKLQMKYGEIALLISMKADFLDTENQIERINLYKQSIDLANDPLDVSVLTQSSGSIAEIYIEELADYGNGDAWLNIYKNYINQYGDKYIVVSPSDLEPKLKRLKIQAIR